MTAKEIIQGIMRQKYARQSERELFIICSDETIDILVESNSIIRWQENHPGMLESFSMVCGMDLIREDYVPLAPYAKDVGYEIVTKNELINRRYMQYN